MAESTPDELLAQLRAQLRTEFARTGGNARTQKLAPARRSAIARRAAMARWRKYRRQRKADSV